ncbi:MAG: hypothetical protein K8R23_12110 [Chthoniobacter sp.]|nr:hypothetical protein [Chthoniobacter sp.]
MKLTHILPITTALLAIALPSPLLAAKGDKKPKDPVKEAIGAALNLYDKDSDHAITGDEIKAVRDAFAADKAGALKLLDTNADGTLDDAEIAAIHKGKGGKGGGKGKKKDAAAAPVAPAPVAPAAPAAEKKVQ